MHLIWTIFIFCLGLCIGSFLNVCIWRIPRRESIVFPPSHCPKCDYVISWYENIPLVSWLVLRGCCCKCKAPISMRYFWVELLTGVMFLAVWLKINSMKLSTDLFIPFLISNLVIVMLIVLTAFIDWDHRIIPNMITYPVMLYGFGAALVTPLLWNTKFPFKAISFSCASVLVCSGALAAFAIIGKKIFKKDALGWGDVKYIAAVAAVLGPWSCFFTVLAGSIIGSIAGVVLIAMKKGKLRTGIPFGPPLAVGTFLWIL